MSDRLSTRRVRLARTRARRRSRRSSRAAGALEAARARRHRPAATVDAERERVGRLDRERVRRQVRAREEAGLQGQGDEHAPRASRPSRRWPTGRSTSSSRTGTTLLGQPAVREERLDRQPRPERRHRPDRLVHPALPAQAVPAVQDVAGAEGQGERVQVARVGLAGHVPRWRPVVRPEGQGSSSRGSGSTSSTWSRAPSRRRSRAGRSSTSRRSRSSSTGTRRST